MSESKRLFSRTTRLATAFGVAVELAHLCAPRDAMALDATEEKVVRILSGYDTLPSERQVRGLGRNGERVLCAVAMDPHRPMYVRYRAVRMLRYFPSQETRQFLANAVIASQNTDPWFAREALLSLDVVGQSDAAIPYVAKGLHSTDAVLQFAVAQTLSRLRSPRGRWHLQRYLREGRNPRLKSHIRSLLGSAKRSSAHGRECTPPRDLVEVAPSIGESE